MKTKITIELKTGKKIELTEEEFEELKKEFEVTTEHVVWYPYYIDTRPYNPIYPTPVWC